MSQSQVQSQEAKEQQKYAASTDEGHWPVDMRHSLPQNISEQERLISLGLGAAVAALGLARVRGSGLLLLAAGAGLLYRGFTGHCSCYQALGMDTSEQTSQ